MQAPTRDNGPDTVIEDGAPDAAATAPLQRHHTRTVLLAGVALLIVMLLLCGYAYQRQRAQLQLAMHDQATLTQQALEMRLDLVRNHVAGMRYAVERALRWPVLADGGFVDRVQQRNLSPVRGAPWERLPADLVREVGALHMHPDAAFDAAALRRDLNAVSAALPAVVSLHGSTPTLWSSYYLDSTQRWRLGYPPQAHDERLKASGANDMATALQNLWPGAAIQPVALTQAAQKAQRASVWTAPFSSPKGLGVALLAPVLLGQEQLGVVGADVGLDLFDFVLVQHAPTIGRALVVNAEGQVLGDSGGALTQAKAPLRLTDVVPGAGTPWSDASPDPAWQRLTLRGGDLFLLLYQPPAALRSAALGPLKPYFALVLVVVCALGALVYWQNRHFTLPALQLVQYAHQLDQSPQRKAPPAPAAWAPWFAQLAQSARERHTLMSATLRHARQQQSEQDSRQAEVDNGAAALAQAQAELQTCQQQLVRAERQAALGPVVTKATQTLLPLLGEAQQTANTVHQHNERLQQGLLHGAPADELQQQALALDQATVALGKQLQGMAPVLAQLRQASTDPTRETPRRFALHTLAEQVLGQLPAAVRREGIHLVNGIPRDIELLTRAQGCGQLLGQALAQTVAQAFNASAEGIVRLSARATRRDDGVDVVLLQITDNGNSHACVVPEHTQRALVQGALGGSVAHQVEQGANVCTITLAQFIDPPAEAATPPSPALPELPSA
ncbi:hypothetical protein RQP54_16540 [Curvibacter sp. APW13]|uniref:hypothetical protein n=1 Tax=Curvibacter sp. APW13 TaxID=3077236 RepID=UPI0028DD8B17|nr:hypothetical protein [Curvibacter sp. APW13]MDT8992480.1 hypothetical protein [Curvibacter sp. APW13]